MFVRLTIVTDCLSILYESHAMPFDISSRSAPEKYELHYTLRQYFQSKIRVSVVIIIGLRAQIWMTRPFIQLIRKTVMIGTKRQNV